MRMPGKNQRIPRAASRPDSMRRPDSPIPGQDLIRPRDSIVSMIFCGPDLFVLSAFSEHDIKGTSHTWHNRLTHIFKQRINELIRSEFVTSIELIVNEPDDRCQSCVVFKMLVSHALAHGLRIRQEFLQNHQCQQLYSENNNNNVNKISGLESLLQEIETIHFIFFFYKKATRTSKLTNLIWMT